MDINHTQDFNSHRISVSKQEKTQLHVIIKSNTNNTI